MRLPANGIECMSSLRYLSFYKCPRLECFNEGIQRLTALRHLSFLFCESLISLPQGLDVLGRLFSQKRMFLVLKIATAYQFSHNMQHRKSQPSLVL
nr:hypothetical protein CFP56_41774 [Quercus suber]